jgi:cell division protein FtsQ
MSTPTRPPSAPNWARVDRADAAPQGEQRRPNPQRKSGEIQRSTKAPTQRNAETALTDAAKSTMSALQTALARTKATVVPPIAQRKDERAVERRRATRRRRLIVWGRRFGYVLVVAGLVWLVLLSPVFALDPAKVEVSGYGTVVDPTAVRAVVGTQAGESLATVSTGHLASNLQDIPGVRAAHVERSWPDALVITLESREPVAAIPDPTGGFTLVDDEGVQVGRSAKAPKDLPKLSVPVDSPRVLEAALGVMAALPADLSARVTAVSAATEDSVSFALAKGPRVEWGSAEDSALKAQVLQVLLESKQARKADVIDVSAPTLPITKNN